MQTLYIVAKKLKRSIIILNKDFSGVCILDNIANQNNKLKVYTGNNKFIKCTPEMIHNILLLYTKNLEAIVRTERLVTTQLANYSDIKLTDLNIMIYESLEKLRYYDIAKSYYKFNL